MSLLDLICPTRCSGCSEPGSVICGRCALVLAAPAVRHRPTPCPPGMPATWVVAGYRGVTRELLLDFKERGVVALGRPLGEGLARAAAAAAVEHPGPLVVVPVPSAASSVRRRGDDVVWLLARRVAGRLRSQGRNVTGVRALRQLHPVADSAGLSAVARAQNLRGALGIRAAAVRVVAGAAVILVDDLVTTGATLAEAAAVLDAAGARVLGAAAVAATARATSW